MARTLHELEAGRTARIEEIDTNTSHRYRLMEMGFVPGALVEVIGRGTPARVRLAGGRVTLSAELARAVRLRA